MTSLGDCNFYSVCLNISEVVPSFDLFRTMLGGDNYSSYSVDGIEDLISEVLFPGIISLSF